MLPSRLSDAAEAINIGDTAFPMSDRAIVSTLVDSNARKHPGLRDALARSQVRTSERGSQAVRILSIPLISRSQAAWRNLSNVLLKGSSQSRRSSAVLWQRAPQSTLCKIQSVQKTRMTYVLDSHAFKLFMHHCQCELRFTATAGHT